MHLTQHRKSLLLFLRFKVIEMLGPGFRRVIAAERTAQFLRLRRRLIDHRPPIDDINEPPRDNLECFCIR